MSSDNTQFIQLYSTLNSVGSRNFEKKGASPEIAKNLCILGLKSWVLLTFHCAPPPKKNQPQKDFYDGAFSFSETLSHSVTVREDMSSSDMWQVSMFTCRCPKSKVVSSALGPSVVKQQLRFNLHGLKSSYTTLIHFTPLCATFTMITYTSSWWVTRSLRPVFYSRLLWIRSSGVTVTRIRYRSYNWYVRIWSRGHGRSQINTVLSLRLLTL
jgi:hypothetical protein